MIENHRKSTGPLSEEAGNSGGLRVAVISYHLVTNGADRPNYVAQAFRGMPFVAGVDLVASNYDHIKKCTLPLDAITRLPVRAYAKNISLRRVLSYLDFARQVVQVPELAGADVVYVCVPDYLSAFAILRLKPPRCYRVMVDVVDLWPEAFPLPSLFDVLLKGILKFAFKPLRRHLFRNADLILFQSGHFLKQFGGKAERHRLLPMCIPGKAVPDDGRSREPIAYEIRLLFLGSLNSITDIDSLFAILTRMAECRRVCLAVVGGGIGLELLQRKLEGTAVRLIARGITFDRRIRDEELRRAHFGFNGYKKTTEVSVSYKALDYLQYGLPIINCTKGDLTNLVNEHSCGFNYTPDNVQAIVERLLQVSDYDHQRMRENARRAFEENYSYSRFHAVLGSCLTELFGGTHYENTRRRNEEHAKPISNAQR